MCPKLVTLVISEPLGSQTSPPTRVSLCLSSGTRKDSMIRFLTTSAKPSPTSRASCSAAQQCWYPQDGLISDQRAADQGHPRCLSPYILTPSAVCLTLISQMQHPCGLTPPPSWGQEPPPKLSCLPHLSKPKTHLFLQNHLLHLFLLPHFQFLSF